MNILPLSRASKPAINLSIEVFPLPEGPSKQAISPFVISNETPSMIGVPEIAK